MTAIDIADLAIAASMLGVDYAQRKDFQAAKRLSPFAGAATRFAKDASTGNMEKFIAAWQNLPSDLQRVLTAEFEEQSGVGAFADRFPMLPAPERV